MLETNDLLKLIFSFLSPSELFNINCANKLFHQIIIDNKELLIAAINRSELDSRLKEWLITPENTAHIFKRYFLTMQTLEKVSSLNQSDFADLMISSNLTGEQALVILYSQPQQVIQFLTTHCPFTDETNIYKSSLPDYTIFKLARKDKEVLMTFLNHPQLKSFINQDPFIRYFCLLVKDQLPVLNYVLDNAATHQEIIKHADFLYPLKRNTPAYEKILNDPILQETMGQLFTSLKVFYNGLQSQLRTFPIKRSSSSKTNTAEEDAEATPKTKFSKFG